MTIDRIITDDKKTRKRDVYQLARALQDKPVRGDYDESKILFGYLKEFVAVYQRGLLMVNTPNFNRQLEVNVSQIMNYNANQEIGSIDIRDEKSMLALMDMVTSGANNDGAIVVQDGKVVAVRAHIEAFDSSTYELDPYYQGRTGHSTAQWASNFIGDVLIASETDHNALWYRKGKVEERFPSQKQGRTVSITQGLLHGIYRKAKRAFQMQVAYVMEV
ncbi:hypothetical protein C4573_07105 [Candidatus Woesearchaeota archaeon]|nr:MAG: hypothetical protein C4573_07105 [Candidatus Woesearchaeota archaeon]